MSVLGMYQGQGEMVGVRPELVEQGGIQMPKQPTLEQLQDAETMAAAAMLDYYRKEFRSPREESGKLTGFMRAGYDWDQAVRAVEAARSEQVRANPVQPQEVTNGKSNLQRNKFALVLGSMIATFAGLGL